MSTWKMNDETGEESPEESRVKAAADTKNPPAALTGVEILEIDVDADMDCDPYNRTGQFCAPVFDKRDD